LIQPAQRAGNYSQICGPGTFTLPPLSGRQVFGLYWRLAADVGGDTVVYCVVHKRFCFCSGQRCGGFQDQCKDKHTLLEQGKFERLAN